MLVLKYLFCLLLVSLFVHAQRGALKKLTINKGLPHTDAHDVTQDAKCFLWLAALDGLCRYNGAEMLVCRNAHSGSFSIRSNRINALQFAPALNGFYF